MPVEANAMNDISAKIREYQPYILNAKALLGLAVIGYAVYAGFTDIPLKFNAYTAAKQASGQLEEYKKKMSVEEGKLLAIDKELEKIRAKTVKVKDGDSPELVVIRIAQMVVTLAESTENTYISLQPNLNTSLDVDASVKLPIEIPQLAPATQPGAPATGAVGAANTAAPAGAAPTPPPAPAAAAPTTGTPAGGFNARQFTLTIRGSYKTLANFLHDLVKMPNFILVNRAVLIGTAESGQDSKIGGDASGEVTLKLDFAVPWD